MAHHPHEDASALPPPTFLETIHVERGVACVNGHTVIRPAPIELQFHIETATQDNDDDDRAPRPDAAASSSSRAPNLADALLDMRWKSEHGEPSPSQKKKKTTLEDVVLRQCARKVLLDHHKYTQPGHVAHDVLLELFRACYDLEVNKERVNASYARLKRNGASTAILPAVRGHQRDNVVTLTFDHPIMAYHFLDRVTCAFDMATAAAVMTWWNKETDRLASVDEWQFYGIKYDRMLKLATLLVTPAEGQFGRSPISMHNGERWTWHLDPESLVKNPSLLMFSLRMAMLMYRGKNVTQDMLAFSSPKVCHLLGLRARGFLRKIDPRPTEPVAPLENEYDQHKSVALQYVYTACTFAFILEAAGLRGLSLRDSLYQWNTLERIVDVQHILQGADSAYIKIEKSRRGALQRPPPAREDAAKRRYIETAGQRQGKVTQFFQVSPK